MAAAGVADERKGAALVLAVDRGRNGRYRRPGAARQNAVGHLARLSGNERRTRIRSLRGARLGGVPPS